MVDLSLSHGQVFEWKKCHQSHQKDYIFAHFCIFLIWSRASEGFVSCTHFLKMHIQFCKRRAWGWAGCCETRRRGLGNERAHTMRILRRLILVSCQQILTIVSHSNDIISIHPYKPHLCGHKNPELICSSIKRANPAWCTFSPQRSERIQGSLL